MWHFQENGYTVGNKVQKKKKKKLPRLQSEKSLKKLQHFDERFDET